VKIERENRAEVRLQDFADQHGLTMRVTEYASPPREYRYCARFVGADISEGCVLIGATGNSHTEDEAIADYAKRISFVTLVIDASTSSRREIATPTFHPYTPDAP
jgi:hypothetical protein